MKFIYKVETILDELNQEIKYMGPPFWNLMGGILLKARVPRNLEFFHK